MKKTIFSELENILKSPIFARFPLSFGLNTFFSNAIDLLKIAMFGNSSMLFIDLWHGNQQGKVNFLI